MPSFNQAQVIHYLTSLVNIPSPSGYTHLIMKWIESQFQRMGVSYEITNKGAIIATIKGIDNSHARLLTAHTDTLGAMVKEIKSNGRLKLAMIGGFNWNSVEGEYCTIHIANGETLTGTIMHHHTSVHVYKESSALPRDVEQMEVRLDAKTNSKEASEKLGIQVGDFISFQPRCEIINSEFIKSRHLDDKACVALLLALIENIVQQKIDLPHTTQFYISNNEEIGFGGNSNIANNIIEYIAVDMGAIGDGQSSDEYSVSICSKDSSGPYHYQLTQFLRQLAYENKIPYNMDIYPYYGSDASAAIRAGFDLRHALIGPGIESSHALERTHIDSLSATYKLLFHYLNSAMIE